MRRMRPYVQIIKGWESGTVMKKIRVLLLAAVMAVTMSIPYAVSAAPYTGYNSYYSRYRTGVSTVSGTAAAGTSAQSRVNHPVNMANYSLSALSPYYYVNGKAKQKDKESLVLRITGGNAGSMDLVPSIAKYVGNAANQYPLSFTLDTGNSAMAAPYDSIFTSQAPALRILGQAGYDYAAIGATELSEGGKGLAGMLNTAAKSGDVVPYLTASNVNGGKSLKNALTAHGAGDGYVLLAKYGVKVAVFNLISPAAAGKVEGISVSDPVNTAKRIVKKVRKENGDAALIVCVTDHGNSDSLDMEKQIASAVSGIDVIAAGGSVSSSAPEKQGSTRIVQVSRDSGQIGTLTFGVKADGSKWKTKYRSFRVNRISSGSGKDAAAASKVSSFRSKAKQAFRSEYGFSYTDVLTTADKAPGTAKELGTSKTDTGLSDLITDSYLRFAAKHGVRADVALLSSDAVKGDLPAGKIGMSEVSTMLSGEKSYDGVAGNPLVSFYVEGSSLKSLAELASSMAKAGDGQGLYFGGVSYTYNPHRLTGNRVYDMKLSDKADVKGSQRYLVVTDRDTLSAVQKLSEKSSSALSVVLRDRNGRRVDRVNNLRRSGTTLRAWAAVSSQLESYGSKGLPASYTKADGRVNYDNSILPSHLMKGANRMTGVILAVIVIAVCVLILLIILLVKIFGGGSGRGGGRGRKGRKVRYPGRTKEHNLFR